MLRLGLRMKTLYNSGHCSQQLLLFESLAQELAHANVDPRLAAREGRVLKGGCAREAGLAIKVQGYNILRKDTPYYPL